MKKTIFITMAACLSCCLANAQSAFNISDKILDIGIGLGNPYWGGGYKSNLPVNPRISFEKGITDAISVGGTLAYSGSKYDYHSYGYDYSIKVNGYFIGGRGAYHFKVNEKIDPYAGASAGYVIVTVKDSEGYGSSAGSGVGYGFFAGARYFPKGKLGVHAELGYTSFSFLSLGASFKF